MEGKKGNGTSPHNYYYGASRIYENNPNITNAEQLNIAKEKVGVILK